MRFRSMNLKIREEQIAGNNAYPRQWMVLYSQLHEKKPNNIQGDS